MQKVTLDLDPWVFDNSKERNRWQENQNPLKTKCYQRKYLKSESDSRVSKNNLTSLASVQFGRATRKDVCTTNHYDILLLHQFQPPAQWVEDTHIQLPWKANQRRHWWSWQCCAGLQAMASARRESGLLGRGGPDNHPKGKVSKKLFFLRNIF